MKKTHILLTGGSLWMLVYLCVLCLTQAIPTLGAAAASEASTSLPPRPGMNATLRSFSGIAQYDWETAFTMMAVPETVREWKAHNIDLFPTPIHSSAFFSHSFSIFSATETNRWIGGVYNLWLDSWLLLEFSYFSDLSAERITRFAWIGGKHDPMLDTLVSPEELAAHLRERFENAVRRGYDAARQMLDEPRQKNLTRCPDKELAAYVRRMRSMLAEDEGAKKRNALREGVERLQKQLSVDATQLSEDFSELIDWPALLTPVYLTKQGNQITVLLSAPRSPGQMVAGCFEINRAGTAVLQEVLPFSVFRKEEER